ncbi:hypothetical protein LTR36_006734 [Oleoguttula mirabilis]|uniref:Uncharacterized protein n=1 Tax=Oleoguttula mirabilis TaxID=1507867 RepID=A0AAV9JBJ3_9PEZI|nr:hypothetical protein LTR36_006734 [Oleoguttula mirabilis]
MAPAGSKPKGEKLRLIIFPADIIRVRRSYRPINPPSPGSSTYVFRERWKPGKESQVERECSASSSKRTKRESPEPVDAEEDNASDELSQAITCASPPVEGREERGTPSVDAAETR